MKLSTLMKGFGWSISKVGDKWEATSTIGVTYTYENGKWDVDPTMMIDLEVALSKHDWTYPMSDDGREWDKGERERKAILNMCLDLDLPAEDMVALRRKHCPYEAGFYELSH